MERNLIIEKTSDGSDTIYVPSMNEHYHSIHGAKQESTHVFIAAGLATLDKKDISIFEVGFGTGLNALLSIEYASKHGLRIDYETVELYPIQEAIYKQLSYDKLDPYFEHIHRSQWNQKISLTSFFKLKKLVANFSENSDSILTSDYDLIYFDAFAPDKQPEMWTQEIFDNIYRQTKIGGKLCTYCAKGEVRRMLQKSGYNVERLEGPPGKREMLRATKL